MPFFKSSLPVVVYLHSHSCSVYFSGNRQKIDISYPPTLVANQDVIDLQGLSTLIASALTKFRGQKQSAILVLSPEVYYQKNFPQSDKVTQDFEIENFIGQIPFDSHELAIREVASGTNISVFATSKNFFFAFKNAFDALGFQTGWVVPASLFIPNPTQELSEQHIQTLSEQTKLLESANFLKIQSDEETTQENGSLSSSRYKKVLIAIPIIVVIVGLALFGIYTILSPGPKPRQTMQTASTSATITPETEKVASSSATEATSSAIPASAREALEIQVINGSGISGQAGKLQQKLLDLGYTKTTIGTSTSTRSTETHVAYPADTDPQIEDEITALLQIYFSRVIVNSASISATPVQISTGSQTSAL